MAITRHIEHIKSKVVENNNPKLPTASEIHEGEIAVNFAKDYETLSIKNSSGDIVTFSSDKATPWEKGSGISSALLKGGSNTAIGNYSVAEGYGTIASGNTSHAEGNSTKAVGDYSHAEGYNTSAVTNYSHAEGYNSTASGLYSHAEGYTTTASRPSSHAEGDTTTASGLYSHAEGNSTIAGGQASHAEGDTTKAYGQRSHAEGYNSTASGTSSHAEGYNTSAVTNYSHAEGYNTRASGASSHAEGNSTIAGGLYSHAEGNYTIAGGQASHAEGNQTKTTNDAEHASGRFNISSKANTTFGDTGNTLFSVGNGSTTAKTHNAIDIRQNGDIYIVDVNNGTGSTYDVKGMMKLQDRTLTTTEKTNIDALATNIAAISGITAAKVSAWDNPPTYCANVPLATTQNYIREPEFKTVKINGSTTNAASTENCVLQYDNDNKCVKFIFN